MPRGDGTGPIGAGRGINGCGIGCGFSKMPTGMRMRNWSGQTKYLVTDEKEVLENQVVILESRLKQTKNRLEHLNTENE